MTINLQTVLQGLPPEQQQRIKSRVAQLIAEDPALQSQPDQLPSTIVGSEDVPPPSTDLSTNLKQTA